MAKYLILIISNPTCLAMLRDHSSRSTDSLQFTLQHYYVPEALFFKFVGDGNCLTHIPWIKDRPDPPGIAPLIPLSKTLESSNILHFDASMMKILPRYSSNADDVLSDAPGTVMQIGDPRRYHFKAVQGHKSLFREFRILLEIKQSRLDQTHRLPSIHGLFHYSNEPQQVLGMLLEYIENEGTLADSMASDRITRSVKQRWKQQIKETLLELHSHGIVWGDVKPGNVLIDSNENACLIDFGGGFNSVYVDENVMETVEGDMQGVSRIMEALSWV
jgi:Protein kinase domain